MRVLVIGSGAREHALLWKLAQSPRVTRLWAAPGNPGMAALAECVPIGLHELERLAEFAERQAIDFTVVGPEAPLIAGLVDVFEARGLPIFGPRQAGALLEGSKAFAKELMEAAGIPTAQHRSFRDPAAALAYLEEHGAPVVVKADGNAAGKGAIVALDLETARTAVQQMMVERVFGSAGEVVVIEDYLQGDEIGSTALCNGTSFVPLVLTQDHKRALDNDEGLNTGGMGAYAPLPFVSAETERVVQERIIAATLRALQERGIAFSGVLYSNIMLTERGPMVLEHNVRFGDPETQAMMLLLERDVDLLTLLQEPQRLAGVQLWRPGYAVSLTLASGGYPGSYRTGLPIRGLAEASRLEQVQVFHAGTALRDGELVTAGGRVLSVAAYGATLAEALARAYEAARLIHFEGMHYRRDIAKRGLRALQS
uniref:Phosphoribosylamine--glycine ligase n=1 Tax=Thermogemmatispora argillosa TaxID=2045280 RepID=A0A455T758_9CHLR|nr:phosphoribosylamine--glycine ligase [Thermogemmatispora argillosa]